MGGASNGGQTNQAQAPITGAAHGLFPVSGQAQINPQMHLPTVGSVGWGSPTGAPGAGLGAGVNYGQLMQMAQHFLQQRQASYGPAAASYFGRPAMPQGAPAGYRPPQLPPIPASQLPGYVAPPQMFNPGVTAAGGVNSNPFGFPVPQQPGMQQPFGMGPQPQQGTWMGAGSLVRR